MASEIEQTAKSQKNGEKHAREAISKYLTSQRDRMGQELRRIQTMYFADNWRHTALHYPKAYIQEFDRVIAFLDPERRAREQARTARLEAVADAARSVADGLRTDDDGDVTILWVDFASTVDDLNEALAVFDADAARPADSAEGVGL